MAAASALVCHADAPSCQGAPPARFRMFQRHNIVPCPQMHIAPQILAGLHGTGWHAGVLQETHGLVWGTLAGPGT